MKRQGLLSASGILLLGLVVLMTLHEWGTTLPGEDDAALTAPAIIAHQVTARAFNEVDGGEQYHLTAESLEQYDHRPLTRLTRPNLTVNNTQGAWTIHSKKGTVRRNGDVIVFLGDVDARNPEKKIQLNTQRLRFFSQHNKVEAPTAVEVNFESGRTKGGAMQADLDTGTLTFSKGVQSEFEAPAS